ncbi:hypothetical protein IWQ62_005429 [Dispira parvispora]|uniref:Uncharacterized protein n=1 Tax=Dispira parvispora TaxID=1520584 RepID=A0A9W8AMV0_9FUNG|nr:hypothetical protein IWQ62_005429 [Dispira parvispora]
MTCVSLFYFFYPLTKDLRTDYQKWKQLAVDSNVTDSTPLNTNIEGFDENTAKDLTRVFTHWLKGVMGIKDDKKKEKAYRGATYTAEHILEYFEEARSKVSSENDKPFTYHKALSEKAEDWYYLTTSLKTAKESLKSRRPELLKSSKRKREETRIRNEILDLEKRLSVSRCKNLIQEKFSELLKSFETLDKESYTQLKELEEIPEISADEGNKIMKDLYKKWKMEMEKYVAKLNSDTPQELKYADLKDVELFIYFPLLHARKHGSPRYVAQLLSLIKSTLIDNSNPVNQGNTNTSSSVAVDDDLFYDVIIPHVLLAYVHDEGLDKAKEFVSLTEEESYRLYDTDDLHGLNYIGFKPELTLMLTRSDYDKQSKLVDELQSEVGK